MYKRQDQAGPGKGDKMKNILIALALLIWPGLSAVSYTHLDVYKRQINNRRLRMSTVDAVNPGRRRFLTLTATVVGGVGAAFVAVPFLKSWSPSERDVYKRQGQNLPKCSD